MGLVDKLAAKARQAAADQLQRSADSLLNRNHRATGDPLPPPSPPRPIIEPPPPPPNTPTSETSSPEHSPASVARQDEQPPPTVQEPEPHTGFMVKLAAGDQIRLGTNLQFATNAASLDLLGHRPKDVNDKPVRVVLFRDPSSKFKNSVRLETFEGNLIGWVLKSDSDAACRMIDAVSKQALKEWKRKLKGESVIRFDVSALVSGVVERQKGNLHGTIEMMEIRVKDPVKGEIKRH